MIGTPRSLAALRWSPARIPSPPEYCGSAAAMPNSGEKYAIARGPSDRALVPELVGEVGAQVVAHARELRDELRLLRQLRQALRGHAAEHLDGVLRALPQLGVHAREHVLRLAVPAPAQVPRQLPERGQRRGQDGSDGESANRAHAPTVAPRIRRRVTRP